MKKFLIELRPYVIIVVIVVLIRSFIITPGLVRGASMEETLFDKDLVLVNKIGIRNGINRFDIVVINYNGETLIKRVIGLSNETVSYKNNTLYINDVEITTPINFEETNDFELKASEDEFIVLGDNRDVSKDSRIIGSIKKKDIKGKVNFVFFPFKRFGFINK